MASASSAPGSPRSFATVEKGRGRAKWEEEEEEEGFVDASAGKVTTSLDVLNAAWGIVEPLVCKSGRAERGR